MKNLRLTIVFAVLIALGCASASMALVHGLSTAKGTSPSNVDIGDEYCFVVSIVNNADASNDTVVITSVVDKIHAASGDQTSANLINSIQWTLSAGASQDGITGAITLPPGESADNIASPYCTGYLITIADFNNNTNPYHVSDPGTLDDDVTILYHDLCNCANSGCPGGGPSPSCVQDCGGCSTGNRTHTENAIVTITPPLPCINIEKSVKCDVSKPGEIVTYHYKITNCSSNPLESLTIFDINDTVLGNLKTNAQAACGTIAPNTSCEFDVNYPVKQNDPDPLYNKVVVVGIDQFAQKVSAYDDVNVTIIHPDFSVTKTCLTQPVVGNDANYDVAVSNTGDVDLAFTTNEAADSNVAEPFIVAHGATKHLTITIPDNPCEDINNTIVVTGNLAGQTCLEIDDIVKQASAICYCLPSIDVNKVADCDLATPGKLITYTITIKNTGLATLNIVSVGDSILGDLTAKAIAHGCGTLVGGAQCSFDVNRPIQAGDNTPLVNLVTVDYVNGQQVHATDSATASVDIIHPSFTVDKTCTSEPIPAGGPATFNVAIHNTGDVNLSFTTNEPTLHEGNEPFTVVAGATQNLTITVPASGTSDVLNTIDVNGTVVDNSTECPVPSIIHSAQAVCSGGGITRTWGFWAQHCDFTKRVFNCCQKTIDLGWVKIEPNSTGLTKLYTIFRMHNDKKNCAVQYKICQARIQASVQALAAILNTCMSNGASLPIDEDTIKNTLKGCDVNAIMDLGAFLATFNESNDTGTALDCNGKVQDKADGGCAKTLGTACTALQTPCNQSCP